MRAPPTWLLPAALLLVQPARALAAEGPFLLDVDGVHLLPVESETLIQLLDTHLRDTSPRTILRLEALRRAAGSEADLAALCAVVACAGWITVEATPANMGLQLRTAAYAPSGAHLSSGEWTTRSMEGLPSVVDALIPPLLASLEPTSSGTQSGPPLPVAEAPRAEDINVLLGPQFGLGYDFSTEDYVGEVALDIRWEWRATFFELTTGLALPRGEWPAAFADLGAAWMISKGPDSPYLGLGLGPRTYADQRDIGLGGGGSVRVGLSLMRNTQLRPFVQAKFGIEFMPYWVRVTPAPQLGVQGGIGF